MIDRFTVDDFMTHLVVSFRPRDLLHFVARKLIHNGISGAPVIDNGKLVGIVSETDIGRGRDSRAFRQIDPPLLDRTVDEIMTRRVVIAHPGDSILEAAALLDRHGLRRLPVVDVEGYVVGVIARADIVRAIAADHSPRAATA